MSNMSNMSNISRKGKQRATAFTEGEQPPSWIALPVKRA